MEDFILKYLENERELSKFNIQMLERKKETAAIKRLIGIEKDFISIPFETLNLRSLSELQSAIELYRNSRNLFYLKFQFDNNKDEIITKISKKSTFLEITSRELLTKRVEEINLVQDSVLYQNLKTYLKESNKPSLIKIAGKLKEYSLEELLKLEPAIIARKRARIQTAIYSLGLSVGEFVEKYLSINTSENLQFLDDMIDSFVNNLPEQLYKYYNISIPKMNELFSNSMGKNYWFDKIHYLENILDAYTQTQNNLYTLNKISEINFQYPKIINIYPEVKTPFYYDFKKDSEKQTKNRVYGILFPIERVSREKMTLLYKEIYSNNINITKLFSDSISNIRVLDSNGKVKYYKGILMKPAWELLKFAENDVKFQDFLSKFWELDIFDISKFSDINYIKKFNFTKISGIKIDTYSKIYVSKTRSEEDSLNEIFPLLYNRIDNIITDYRNIS